MVTTAEEIRTNGGGIAAAVPSGKDTPVSNAAEATEADTVERQQEANEGTSPGNDRPTASGVESVEFEMRSESMALAERTMTDDLDFPDVATASFGRPADPTAKPVLESIIGDDDRVRIHNTADYPWRVHASLAITAADGSMWIGTGWFIGPHTLVTAGHVVYIKNSGVPGRDGFVRSISVMPGRNGKTLPFGSVTSTNFRTVRGWADDGDENFDYGAILLSTDLGKTTGWFGFGVYDDATLTSSVGNISGYPGDQPSGTQWYHGRTIVSVGPRKVFYDADTFGGQSGSAVYRIVDGERYGVAVHAYGGTTTNSGTRITDAVYANLLAWKA